MSNRLNTEILINLTGNLTAKARQYGANMSEFARRSERAMSVVKATASAAGRGIDALGNRYTAAIAGFGGSAMLRDYTATERQLTQLGIVAGKTRAEMKSMYEGIQDRSFNVGINPKSLLETYNVINGMMGGVEFAAKNDDTLAATLAATGVSGEDLGALVSQFPKFPGFDKDSPRDLKLAVDGLNRLGKEGSFELGHMAKYLPSLFSAAAAMGQTGQQGIMNVGILSEAANDLTGNPAISATHIQSLFTDVQSGKTEKALKDVGILTRNKDGGFRDIVELATEIARKSLSYSLKSGKSQTSLLEGAGFTDYSVRFLQSMSTPEAISRMERYRNVVADGKSIFEDAKYASDDFASSLQRLSISWEKFSNSQLSGPVRELADYINSVDQNSVQNWLNVGKQIAIAGAGIIAARKAFQLGKGAWDLFGGGKSKGIPKGVSDTFGSGVMPVYVVNMGAGGMGVPDMGGGKNPRGGWRNSLGSVAMMSPLAATIPFLAEEPKLTDNEKAGMVKWAQERAKGPSVWSRVSDWINSASEAPQIADPRPWASMQPQNQSGYPFPSQQIQGHIEVEVHDKRVQVRNVKINAPTITMSAGTGLRNVEQS
ncbi:phage tail tape measure protein [Klebsiella pneumoniae]|uniref:phage tail tape measure protein n=1 Tax=Klebsiella pneumoniae TaxID=573 RepID=UPI002557B802|nr:phage tail tape measure protein [Klebsiella pneumoniae]MEC5531003.1 phage tail tape measure protein [Klebsiella pneumoniae]MEC5531047.1 phage tail tape measure protein [Klebsiella pneumoniae]